MCGTTGTSGRTTPRTHRNRYTEFVGDRITSYTPSPSGYPVPNRFRSTDISLSSSPFAWNRAKSRPSKQTRTSPASVTNRHSVAVPSTRNGSTSPSRTTRW